MKYSISSMTVVFAVFMAAMASMVHAQVAVPAPANSSDQPPTPSAMPQVAPETAQSFPVLSVTTPASGPKWEQCHSGRKGGISGIAPLNPANGEYLVILDNKKPDDDHVAILDYKPGAKPGYSKVEWPVEGEHPVDLESVTSAGMIAPNSYFTLASSGRMFHIQLTDGNRRLKVLKIFDMPGTASKDNFEASFIFQAGDKIAIIWASRGENKTPSTVRWGTLNPTDYTISAIGSTTYVANWNKPAEIRHIADIFVDADGTVYTLAAADDGDAGPFFSAIFRSGTLVVSNTGAGAIFKKAQAPEQLYDLDGYKSEGFVLDSANTRTFVIGSDDEDSGSFVCRIPAK